MFGLPAARRRAADFAMFVIIATAGGKSSRRPAGAFRYRPFTLIGAAVRREARALDFLRFARHTTGKER
jgi:hypothetical protein